MNQLFLFLIVTLLASTSFAEIRTLRWTVFENTNASLDYVVNAINQRFGTDLADDDFLLLEERMLANNQLFKMYIQTVGGVPVLSTSIRTWTEAESGKAILSLK
jgi:hypothetical protein